MKNATFINPETGQHKTVFIGLAWLVLFFGGFVLLFKRQPGRFLIYLTLALFTAYIGAMILNFIWFIRANRIQVHKLLKAGFIPATQEDYEKLTQKGYDVPTPDQNANKFMNNGGGQINNNIPNNGPVGNNNYGQPQNMNNGPVGNNNMQQQGIVNNKK